MIIGFKVWLILSLFLISKIDSGNHKHCVKYDQMKKWEYDVTVTIIDVRERFTYEHDWHFNRSINIPPTELNYTLQMENITFHEKYGQYLPGRESNIVLVNWFGDALWWVNVVRDLNFTNVYQYCGGYLEWTEKQKIDPM